MSIRDATASVFFQRMLLLGLLVFLALQFWLVRSTVRMFRRGGGRREIAEGDFHLKLSTEVIWTAVPIVMTLALALASLPAWSSLGAP